MGEAFELGQPRPFRSRSQRLSLLLTGVGLQGLTEQVRLGQQALAVVCRGIWDPHPTVIGTGKRRKVLGI